MESKVKIVSILLVDIVNYTSITSRLNKDSFDKFHNIFDKLIKKTCKEYKGKIIKKIGDAFLIIFDSVTASIKCGIKLQKTFSKYRKKKKVQPIHIRVCINVGEVLIRKNDIYGSAVNIVAKIGKFVKSDEVVFSGVAYLAMDKSEIPFTHIGTKFIKGLKMPPVRLFKVKL